MVEKNMSTNIQIAIHREDHPRLSNVRISQIIEQRKVVSFAEVITFLLDLYEEKEGRKENGIKRVD